MNNGSPWVIVTTIAQHNTINGRVYTLELDDFEDRAKFLDHCAKLFDNETDPSFMFVDWSPCLKPFVSEHGIDPAAFELAEMNQHDRQAIAAWCLHFGIDHELPRTQDQFERVLYEFKGIFSTGKDFCKHQWFQDAQEQGIKLDGLLGELAIDWEATWNADMGLKYIQIEFMSEQYFFSILEHSIF